MNTVIKRLVCGFLAFLVLIVSVIIPDFSSFADNENTNTFANVCNGYTSNDFLSTPNYNSFFMGDNLTSEEEGIKNSVYKDIFVNNSNANFGTNMWTLLKNDINNNMQNIGNTYFHNVEGYRFSYFRYNAGSSGVAYFNCVAVGSDDISIVQNTVCSKSDFVVYDVKYNDQGGAFNGTFTFVSENTSGNHATLSDGIYKYVLMPQSSNIRYLYSEMPLYLTYSYDSNYSDLSYLGNSPYDYDEVDSVYNAIGSDTTGFVIDRRTEHMIEETTGGGGTVNPNNYGFLDGSFDALIYGSSFDDQGFFVAYQLNDDSATIKDQLYLKLNYQFDLDGIFSNNEFDYSDDYYSLNGVYDMYSLQDSSYINVDLNTVFSRMNTLDRSTIGQYQNIYKKFNNSSGGFAAAPQTVNPLGAFDILYKNGLLTSAPIAYNIDNPLIQSLGGTYKGFNFQVGVNTSALYNESGVPEISRLDSCLITITISIYNVMTGDESSTYLYSYDYKSKTAAESGSLENGGTFGGTYNDGSQASISNPNSSELGYNIANGSQYPVSSGSSSNATGNYVIVQDSPYPYVLVDIPENEWIAKTPNLKTLLETYKDALATTKDESILPLIAQTYNYLPSEAMQYLIYGVGIIVMIGIWRAITRR